VTGPRVVRVEERSARVERVTAPPTPQVIRAGLAGPRGRDGTVAATLPWESITNRPEVVTEDEITLPDLVLLLENKLA
jgi:hypothetical protein